MKLALSVTLVHQLAGRLRVKLSRSPRDRERFIDGLVSHEGFLDISFNPISHSLLITYEGDHLTTQEILLRTAIALSMEYDFQPVQVKVGTDIEVMTDAAMMAGLLLLSAGAVKMSVGAKNTLWLNRAAGIGVAAAVLEHGWREARDQGYIHPEVLSIGYLVASLFRGTILRGAAVTWIASFGRHLLEGPEKCVEVCPLEQENSKTGVRTYQVALVPQAARRSTLFQLVQGLLSTIGLSGFAKESDVLFQELRNVAQAHDQVLEGLDLQQNGIPLTFKQEI
jgi:hypothetical protein